MNGLAGSTLLDATAIERLVRDRDAQLGNPFAKDAQVVALLQCAPIGATGSTSDLPPRVCSTRPMARSLPMPDACAHRSLKGGIETDLGAGAVRHHCMPAGEAAGFGGG